MQQIRQLLNSGYKQGMPAIRLIGEDMKPQAFDVYSPKILAAIPDWKTFSLAPALPSPYAVWQRQRRLPRVSPSSHPTMLHSSRGTRSQLTEDNLPFKRCPPTPCYRMCLLFTRTDVVILRAYPVAKQRHQHRRRLHRHGHASLSPHSVSDAPFQHSAIDR
jgi:hypothetical protein